MSYAKLVLGFLLLCARLSRACSGNFDNNVFPLGDREILSLPVGDFARELAAMGMKVVPTPDDKTQAALSEAEIDELKAGLQAAGVVDVDQRSSIVNWYRTARVSIRPRNPQRPLAAEFRIKIPKLLPREFELYLLGAQDYWKGNLDAARGHWQRLLDLPPSERKHRSVWAAYMIGRTYVGGEVEGDEESIRFWMRRTRDLAAHGFADSQDLARAAMGWEAQVSLHEGDFATAFALYFQAGDVASLADGAQMAFSSKAEVLDALAHDPLSQRVMTALVMARGGPWRPDLKAEAVEHWLTALEGAGISALDYADRIAWGAYEHGQIELARRWLGRAKKDSLLTRWLDSKFLLRDGKQEESAKVLAALVRDWPADERWNTHFPAAVFPHDQMVGELGMLTLQRGRYIEAIDLLLNGGFFEEAAYIGERVLTLAELKSYVDQNWPVDSRRVPNKWGNHHRTVPENVADSHSYNVARDIRYLLARRLTRNREWKSAREYFPPEIVSRFDEYMAALDGANDSVLNRDERGESLWRAAQIARRSGMELMGTELEPDEARVGGIFGHWNPVDSAPFRVRRTDPNPITAPSKEEAARVRAHHPEPDKRFHYRYIAAEHAWAAAQLLADESDLKAQVLCKAGNWLATYDPGAAEKFYKSLVRDCGTTRLGRLARKMGWLPYL